jgi:transposase
MSAPDDIGSFSVAHLPIVKEYAQRMGLVEIIDGALNCGMHTNPGKIVLGLIMNILCGRSPIYRVQEFFKIRDVQLLLGDGMTAEMLNDDAIGRVLDRIHDYGTWKLFSEVCLQAFRNFNVDGSIIHQDTTSVSVWGEYKPGAGDPMQINHGYSKDKRPDLKQFVLSLLCVEGNLPFHAGILDGNSSDKKINGNIITELPRIMARYGTGEHEFIYVADSALATNDNLLLMKDDIHFITRLPENFGACAELIEKAVAVDCSWQDVGQLSSRIVKGKNICASYRIQETNVDLAGRNYRALVVHSDAHDRRRRKRIEKTVQKDKSTLGKATDELSRKKFFCLPDAQAAAKEFKQGDFHEVTFVFEEQPVYGRGRPCKNETRAVKNIVYEVVVKTSEKNEAIKELQEKAGCFVLLTNVPTEKKNALDVLKTYKEQDGIEKNFGFLKDPLVVNDLFLKTPSRIEALGLVLVLSLLLWRLMERSMRRKIKEDNSTLTGWNNCKTVKPTSFMMVSKFISVVVAIKNGERSLFTPLNKVQLAYLDALEVNPDIFTKIDLMPDGIRSG